jgi:hypothetical protein
MLEMDAPIDWEYFNADPKQDDEGKHPHDLLEEELDQIPEEEVV